MHIPDALLFHSASQPTLHFVKHWIHLPIRVFTACKRLVDTFSVQKCYGLYFSRHLHTRMIDKHV